MGLFGNKPEEGTIYQTSYMGFWIKVYPNRVDFKSGVGSQSIPINQVASVQLAMMGIMQITLETTGGQKYSIPTTKKKEVQQAIYDAQARLAGNGKSQTDVADEIAKFYELKEKEVISQEEFDKKKKQLLGLQFNPCYSSQLDFGYPQAYQYAQPFIDLHHSKRKGLTKRIICAIR